MNIFIPFFDYDVSLSEMEMSFYVIIAVGGQFVFSNVYNLTVDGVGSHCVCEEINRGGLGFNLACRVIS